MIVTVGRAELPDEAAGLTYYALLSVFPAVLGLLGIAGLLLHSPAVLETVQSLLFRLGGEQVAQAMREPLTRFASDSGQGWAVAIGIIGAVWAASGFVTAFGRSMNRLYEVREGRGFVRLIAVQLATTLVVIALALTAVLAASAGARVVHAIANPLGLSETATVLWEWIRPFVLLLALAAMIGVLYAAGSNVRRPVLSWGSLVALGGWLLGTLLLGWYLPALGNLQATYGALAALIGLVLWLWLSMLMLLIGAAFDCERERLRCLIRGEAVESRLLPPLKSTRGIEKLAVDTAHEILRGRDIRLAGPQSRQRR